MDDKEIEKIIDIKVTKEKLKIAEIRNSFLILLFGILLSISGIIVPLLQMNKNTDKIDNLEKEMKTSITEYKKTFQELTKDIKEIQESSFNSISNEAKKNIEAARQDFKNTYSQTPAIPLMDLLFRNVKVTRVVDITGINDWMRRFNLYNRGEAAARDVNVILCVKENSKIKVAGNWSKKEINVDFPFTSAYQSEIIIDSIRAHGFQPIDCFEPFNATTSVNEECMLIVSYGKGDPQKIIFSLVINIPDK